LDCLLYTSGFTALLGFTVPIKRCQSRSVGLGRVLRRLRPLFLDALHERPTRVETLPVAVGPGKLAVDENRTPRILAARGLRVRRNDAVRQRFDSGSFLLGEELPGAGSDCLRRRSRIGVPGQLAGDDARARDCLCLLYTSRCV